MARSAGHRGERGINPSGAPAQFLEEESWRGRLPSGSLVTPHPTFTQPDTGAHNVSGGSIDIRYDPTAQRMKVGNQTTDLNGGLY